EKLNYKKQVEQLNREIYALKNNLGIIIDFKKEKYKREAIGIYSPLLEGKQVELTTYKYKDATIIGKFIEINSFSNIGIWEFQTNTPLLDNDPPEDFVIFGGYENYLNQATSIEDIKKNWKESYKTKNGITMFYGYNYVPKYIGAVTLNSYHNYFHYRNPKPSLLIISYQTVGIPLSAADPAVSKAKEELNKIVDTLELVQPN
ncbi:hypothetical protein HY612_05000, partial [Candidatus Roizmanbacteria bacterium]|nr:hypothetical protein [Candidatus Roizmanbacteria bacterium]